MPAPERGPADLGRGQFQEPGRILHHSEGSTTGDAYVVTSAGVACRISGTQRFPALEPTLYRLDELRHLLAPAA